MNRLILLTLLCLMLSLPALAQEDIQPGYDPEAVSLLKQASAMYQGFTSFSAVIKTRQEYTPHHGQPIVTNDMVTFNFRRPDCAAWKIVTQKGVFERRTDGKRSYLLQERPFAPYTSLPLSLFREYKFRLIRKSLYIPQELGNQQTFLHGLVWQHALLSGIELLDQIRTYFFYNLDARTLTCGPTRTDIGVTTRTVIASREAEWSVVLTIGVYDHLLYGVKETWRDKGGDGVTTIDYGSLQLNPMPPDTQFVPSAEVPQMPVLTALKINHEAAVITWNKGRRNGIHKGDEIALYNYNGETGRTDEVAGGQVAVVRAESCDMLLTHANHTLLKGNVGFVISHAPGSRGMSVKRMAATREDWTLIEMAALSLLQDPTFEGAEHYAAAESHSAPRTRLFVRPDMMTMGSQDDAAFFAERYDRVDSPNSEPLAQELWRDFGRRNAGIDKVIVPNLIVPNVFLHCEPQSPNILIANTRDLPAGLGGDFEFARRYPDVKGEIGPFLPAYSHDHKTALVYMFVGPSAHGCIGTYLFRKERNVWKLVSQNLSYSL